jgi:hypothetical protein
MLKLIIGFLILLVPSLFYFLQQECPLCLLPQNLHEKITGKVRIMNTGYLEKSFVVDGWSSRYNPPGATSS